MSTLHGNEMVTAADRLARAVHAYQTDKAGQPYFSAHIAPITRAVLVHGGSQAMQTIALLHDVVEDSKGLVTLDSLLLVGFPHVIVGSIDALTQRPGESRAEYRERVKRDPAARAIKWFDHARNTTSPTPTTDGQEAADRRAAKYAEDARVINWCAYPNDTEGEHDHGDCIDAFLTEAEDYLRERLQGPLPWDTLLATSGRMRPGTEDRRAR